MYVPLPQATSSVAVGRGARREVPQRQGVNLDRPRGPLHRHALPSQFVQPLTLVMHGADHRRHLLDQAGEAGQEFPQVVPP